MQVPETKVTIIHSRPKLFDDGTFKQAFGDKLEDHISRGFPNVTLIKDDRLLPVEADGGEAAAQAKYVEPAGGKVSTQKGVTIQCDLLFWCVGGRHNFSSYEEHFAGAMEKNGQLKADPFLQVVGHPKVFVAGDICTAGPFGTAMVAGDHATCIAANIKLDSKGSKMTAYKPNRPMNATQRRNHIWCRLHAGTIWISGFYGPQNDPNDQSRLLCRQLLERTWACWSPRCKVCG